jgi:hypothetical protein
MRNQNALARASKIRDGRATRFLENQRSLGNAQDHVLPRVAGAIRAFTVPTAIRLEFAIVAIAKKRIVVDVGFQIDAAAMAAITAGGAAARHVFFATERDATVTAVSGLHQYFGFINEHWIKLPES